MGKLICEKCGWKYDKKDAEKVYNETIGTIYDTYDEWFEGHNYCPDCAKEMIDEYVSECYGGLDAEMIYMSSGEDEDYDFSENGIDPSSYKDE